MIQYIAFSDQGYELACRIARQLGGQVHRSGQPEWTQRAFTGDGQEMPVQRKSDSDDPMHVREWTEAYFHNSDALIYVGAAGIAVRAIAPFVTDKTSDPAVVVMDERALHVIPLLSGHLGGANDLARRICRLTGSDCVITTATDVNGVFAVDEWSKHQNCTLLEKDKIMHISGTLLAGGQVTVYSPWSIEGSVPDGIRLIPPEMDPYAGDWDENEPEGDFEGGASEEIDISLDIEVIKRRPLHLIPRICVLGVGCRRGTSAQAIEELLMEILELTGIHPAAIYAVASIDLKKNEPGLVTFCEEHGWPLLTYSSEQLQRVKGEFSASTFVASITGVDNVCERSAVFAAEEQADPEGEGKEKASGGEEAGSQLIQKKLIGDGVTMALAVRSYRPNWNWKSEQTESREGIVK